ncbi:hypothetical protein L0F63_006394 [Massospora cicadina]|nr:hypothetical protein L0F63_006394 [Massospora cicadina]
MRGAIFIKRGPMGFIVSEKSDESGAIPLTPGEITQINTDLNNAYGLSGGRHTIGVTSTPVRFEKTGMSIKEMDPFSETDSDAAVIYAVLRVPPHLRPTLKHSTFNNAAADMKSFYSNTVIPWGERYAKYLTNFLGLKELGRHVGLDTSGIDELQENKKERAEVDNKNGQTYMSAFLNSAATLNQWLVSRGEATVADPVFDKYMLQMSPEELDRIKSVINLKSNATQKPSKDTTTTQPDAGPTVQQPNGI